VSLISFPFITAVIYNLVEDAEKSRFRWVFCQLDALKDCLDYPRLRQALEDLPETLSETYSRILEGIPRQRMEQATTMLNLLIWSDDIMTLDGLVDAVAVELNHEPGFDPKNRMPVPREVLKLCSSLVAVSWDRWREADVVRLAHFSVKEYLISDHISGTYKSLATETVARAYLARLCLTYILGASQVCPGITSVEELESARSRFPFAKYACLHWCGHAREIETKDESLWRLIISFFLERSGALLFATVIEKDCYWIDKAASSSPILYASSHGLTRAVEYLLDNGAEFTEADAAAAYGYLQEALRLALAHAHDTTVQLLVDRGAVYPRDNYGVDYSLIRASGYGDDATVQLLLDRGVSADTGDGAALIEASRYGHYKTVQLLLDRGATVDARDGAALIEASEYGCEATVQLLLERGADINVKGTDGKTALMRTLELDHHTTTKLLLYKNSPLSLEDLIYALRRTNEVTEESLSIMLPYVTTKLVAQNDKWGKNILHYAAARRSENIVQKLLDLGANFCARDDSERTALHYAAARGHLKNVQMLVQAGSDVEALDGERRTPLAYASNDGYFFFFPTLSGRRRPCADVIQYLSQRSQEGVTEIPDIKLVPTRHRNLQRMRKSSNISRDELARRMTETRLARYKKWGIKL
jgi:ankyrin repeat protein